MYMPSRIQRRRRRSQEAKKPRGVVIARFSGSLLNGEVDDLGDGDCPGRDLEELQGHMVKVLCEPPDGTQDLAGLGELGLVVVRLDEDLADLL